MEDRQDNQKNITVLQAVFIIMSSMIGVSVLSLPRIVAAETNTGVLVSISIGLLILLIGIIFVTLLGMRFPTQSFIEYSEVLIGKWLSRFMGVVLVLIFMWLTSGILREFVDVMNAFLLVNTPHFVVLMTILLVVAITSRNDIQTFAIILFFYLPFIVIPAFALVLFAIPDATVINIQPYLGNLTSFNQLVKGGIELVGLPFSQITLLILSVIIPYMKAPQKAIKGGIIGWFASFLFILIIIGTCIAVLGVQVVQKETWPILTLARRTELPMEILERLDVFYVIIWIISGFTTMLSGYILVIYNASKILSFKHHRKLSFLVFPIFILIVLSYESSTHYYYIMERYGKYCLLITFMYPILLYIIALIRRKGVQPFEKKEATVSPS